MVQIHRRQHRMKQDFQLLWFCPLQECPDLLQCGGSFLHLRHLRWFQGFQLVVNISPLGDVFSLLNVAQLVECL